EVFDDHIGIDDDIVIVQDQHRQFLQRVDLGIFVVRLARHHCCRRELDSVDPPKLDRGNTNLACKRRGRGEGEFHVMPLESSLHRHGRACPGHPRLACGHILKTWMPGTSPGMTRLWMWLRSRRYDRASTISCRCSPRPSMPSVT